MKSYFDKADSGEWIEVAGRVVKLLHDDLQGAEHQRFIIGCSPRQTLLIVHNTDLAGRVPLGMGDRIHVQGIYEWNDLGGVVHWTHHDPHSNEEGGYIRFQSRTYR